MLGVSPSIDRHSHRRIKFEVKMVNRFATSVVLCYFSASGVIQTTDGLKLKIQAFRPLASAKLDVSSTENGTPTATTISSPSIAGSEAGSSPGTKNSLSNELGVDLVLEKHSAQDSSEFTSKLLNLLADELNDFDNVQIFRNTKDQLRKLTTEIAKELQHESEVYGADIEKNQSGLKVHYENQSNIDTVINPTSLNKVSQALLSIKEAYTLLQEGVSEIEQFNRSTYVDKIVYNVENFHNWSDIRTAMKTKAEDIAIIERKYNISNKDTDALLKHIHIESEKKLIKHDALYAVLLEFQKEGNVEVAENTLKNLWVPYDIASSMISVTGWTHYMHRAAAALASPKTWFAKTREAELREEKELVRFTKWEEYFKESDQGWKQYFKKEWDKTSGWRQAQKAELERGAQKAFSDISELFKPKKKVEREPQPQALI